MILKTSSEQGKLRFYYKIKMEFKIERYLSVIQNLKTKSCVAKFKISAHKFPIETGRHKNIERQNCIRTLCERGTGDELHCFSNCNNALLQMNRENHISLRKPKVFALQILQRYLTKQGRVRKFFHCLYG